MARRTTVADYHQDSREPHPLSSSFSAFSAPPSSAETIQNSPAAIHPRTRSAARAENSQHNVDTSTAPSTGNAASRKRKSIARRGKPHEETDPPPQASPPARKTKRQRTVAPAASSSAPTAAAVPPSAPPQSRQLSRNRPNMSQAGPSSQPPDDTSRHRASSSNSRRKSGKNGKSSRRDKDPVSTSAENNASRSPSRRPRRRSPKQSPDLPMGDADSQASEAGPLKEDADDQSSQPSEADDDNQTAGLMDDDDGDPFRNALFGSRAPLGLQNTLRALTGMMSSMSSRLRDLLSQLRMKNDPSIQLIALQELSDLLLVSNEDNLSGQFSPDSFVKELVKLMQPSETGEENPEIMLLACRCLANMMEALRGSVTHVVYGGAVPVLCQKLLDIQFIDLAEQALSTLAKISEDFPASIVREGGLTACLTYLDFFPTSTQRTAVTTAANCCRSLPGDSFPVIRDVMPTLLNVLSSNDQRVVEQACLCVSRIVESFRNKPEKLEELIEPAMLKAILRLLVPGTTNLIGPNIHTQFLRVLGIVAHASPRLSVELLRMDVVDTLYQILTGISAPRDDDAANVKVDNVVIMQALVHRPREQVYETLGVICELLPGSQASQGPLSRFDNALTINLQSRFAPMRSSKSKESADERRALLVNCKPELKRFAMILLPTLTDVYSSTVNLGVRQKVLLAQLKIVQETDALVLQDALRSVHYASFLAAILSQKDHPLLVSYALQCAQLLFERLPSIYRYQFHREGVIAEITELAAKPLSTEKESSDVKPSSQAEVPTEAQAGQPSDPGAARAHSEDEDQDDEVNDEEEDEQEDDDDERDDEEEDDEDRENDEGSESESSESLAAPRLTSQNMDDMMQDHAISIARSFVQIYEQSGSTDAMAEKANQILSELQDLTSKIKSTYEAGSGQDYTTVFQTLASYFEGDALESITSAELLRSGIIDALVESFTSSEITSAARVSFLKAFMGSAQSQQGSVTTPFSKLIGKLHDLLSRTEHFEVITVGHNSLEITRSNATHMLGKQVRLRLIAEDGSDIPRPYKNITVSIHAIATFKSLDDFLRPRINLSERTRPSRNLDFLSQLTNADRLRESANASQSSTENDPQAPFPRAGGATHSDRQRGIPKELLSALRDELDGRDRRHGTHRSTRAQPPNMREDEPSDDRHLECADEKQLSDEDDDGETNEEQDEELNAIVDDLDEELSDTPAPEPTAVNMEIASTGKVTARKEDGTRVATPSQSQALGRGSSSASTSELPTTNSDSLATAGRPFSSYAAAVASIPQDWHIQFSIDGAPITNDTTVYRAIHHSRAHNVDGRRNVWTSEHTVQFKRASGPPPEASSLRSSSHATGAQDEQTGLPKSLSKEQVTGSILQLLRLLHEMNAHLDDVRAENPEMTAIAAEPLAQFINNKLTAKLNRQLEEPLIVASSCLPTWSEDLAREFPFLFPFETRHLFLQSTAFGYSRSMMRWQNSQTEDNRRDLRRDDRPFLGRLQRQKVRISRSRILDSAMKVMELYGSSASILEVEYFEEVGTGLGPTLEFYSTVSKEFSKKKLKIWRENESSDQSEYAFGKNGLFPAPISNEQAGSELGKKQLFLFKSLGKFVARSMLDSRIIDINFNPTFFRIGNNGFVPSLGAIKTVDEGLANSLRLVKRFAKAKLRIAEDNSLSADQKVQAYENLEIDGVTIDDLSLDFTLPGYPSIELIGSGSNTNVDIYNVDTYLDRVIDFTLGRGVERQIEAFRIGFSQVFPYSAIRAFTPNELVMLFGRVEEDWSMETLMDSIKADHGFNMDSKSVRNLLQTMSELDPQQRRDFLQFVTGSPKLPIGGFKSLTPMFTVVCRPSEPPYTPDDYLPSVMTCVNYLKLPDYSSLEVLRDRLLVATKEGQGAFHLS